MLGNLGFCQITFALTRFTQDFVSPKSSHMAEKLRNLCRKTVALDWVSMDFVKNNCPGLLNFGSCQKNISRRLGKFGFASENACPRQGNLYNFCLKHLSKAG